MSPSASFTAAEVIAARLAGYRRILIFGEAGTGKSTLALELLQLLTGRTGCRLLELDPGSPPFGVPGTICLASWSDRGPSRHRWQALCTLDAGRFRLPLILAARRLLATAEPPDDQAPVIIDPPGVVRGVGGAELLMAMTETLEVDAVVALTRDDPPPLAQELAALPARVFPLPCSPAARTVARLEQLKQRTRLWDNFLSEGSEQRLSLDRLQLIGTPPPLAAPQAWAGRQAALLDAAGETVGMGEVLQLTEGQLVVRMVVGRTAEPASILVRDAGRSPTGRLETVKRPDVRPTAIIRREPVEMGPPAMVPKPGHTPVSSNLGEAWATLVGGVFGDPLVHVRLRQLQQSLLFDLGDPARLAARVAHQVKAIFLSHAHIDHIGGFTWFLRSRLGPFGSCRVFGPVGTIRRLESLLGGITWDRIDDRGPIFEVCDIGETALLPARLQPGRQRIDLPELPVRNGVILTEKHFLVKAAVCDHGIPSIAYALHFPQEIKVRRDRLAAEKLAPGRWLAILKGCIAAGTPEVEIRLPDGGTGTAGQLAEALTIIRPGKKLAYAADMADTPANREKVIALARSAHTFFCEAAFTIADRAKAEASQHLTTLAAVQIARQAGVRRLVPFHFSKRYEPDSRRVYGEILAAAGDIEVLGC